MKILIINQHSNNHGDEAAFLGLLRYIEQNNHSLIGTVLNATNIDASSVIIKEQTNVLALRASNVFEKGAAFLGCQLNLFRILAVLSVDKFRTLVEQIRQSDIVVIGPGGENIGAYRDWLYLFNVIIALSLGKKVIFPGNSFGPSGSQYFDRLAIDVLRRCIVVAREEVSLQYLRQNGVDANSGADCALLLFADATRRKVDEREDYAVFVPNFLWKWHPRYQDKAKDLEALCISVLESLAGKFERIVLLPQTFPYPNKIEDFSDLLPEHLRSRCEVVSHASPFEQLEIASKASCLVGMRYHSIVFGAMVGTPCFAYGYERKMFGFNQRYFGGAAYVDLSAEKLEKQLPLPISIEDFALPDLSKIDNSVKDLESLLTRLLHSCGIVEAL